MANNSIQILLTAKDQTSGAFSSVKRGLDGIQSAGSKIGGLLNSIGVGAGLSAAGFVALAKTTIDYADSLNDLSQRTGVSVKNLASLKLAAEQNGTSLEAVAKGIQRITLSIGQAVTQNNKTTAEALERLKVNSTDARERLFQLADAYTRAGDKTKIMADLQAVLGKSYVELLPLLAQGGDELRRLTQESESYAETMARLAPDADRFNDQLAELKQQAAGASAALLERLVPSLSETAARVRELMDEDKGVQALVRAFAGLGKIPWDIAISNPKAAETAAERIGELNAEIESLQLKLQRSRNIGIAIQAIIGKPDEIQAQIDILRNQIGVLEKFGEKIYKPRPSAATPQKTPQQQCAEQGGKWVNGECILNLTVTPKVKPPKWEDVFTREEFTKAERAMAAAGELSFSFITNDKTVADFIRKQYDAVNGLQAEIAETMKMYDALASGSYLTGDEATADFIREQQDAINDLNRSIADSIEKESERAEKVKETKTLAEELGLTFTSAFEDAIASGENFSDVLKAIEQDIIKLLARTYVTDPLMTAVKGIDFGAIIGSLFGSAKGNVFTGAPALSAYSGQIVSKPTLFPFASGGVPNLGLMGEAGAEAIIPLRRGPGGVMGVEAAGNVQVNVINNASGTQATASERMEGGNRIIDVVVEQVVSTMASRVTRGGNALSTSLERTYGLNRTAGAY